MAYTTIVDCCIQCGKQLPDYVKNYHINVLPTGILFCDICARHSNIEDPSSGEYFTEKEADFLFDNQYRAVAEYSGVPSGTIGKVTGKYPVEFQGKIRYGVYITWQGIRGYSPLSQEKGGLTDGFSKGDLLATFTGGENKGKRAMEPVT